MTKSTPHMLRLMPLLFFSLLTISWTFPLQVKADTPITVYSENNPVETVYLPTPSPTPATPNANSPTIIVNQAPSSTQLYAFSNLNQSQQKILEPLRPFWDDMTFMQKKKWLSVADQYSYLSTLSQGRLREKMQEWARLTPQQRKVARENFTNVQTSGMSDKQNQWQEYQKLSPESKQILIERAQQEKKELQGAEKPVGTAATTRPKNKTITINSGLENQIKPSNHE